MNFQNEKAYLVLHKIIKRSPHSKNHSKVTEYLRHKKISKREIKVFIQKSQIIIIINFSLGTIHI